LPMSAGPDRAPIVRGHTDQIARGERVILHPLAVTVEEGAHMLGISRATMYKHVKRGDIESFTIGRSRRIAISVLERFVKGSSGHQRDNER
jgi:excisionase family DNA binding protein